MSDFKTAADKLNQVAPPGERLAYVNPSEERLLKSVGGMGRPAAGGVPSYKKGDVSPPPPRKLGEEMATNLITQANAMRGEGEFEKIGPLIGLEGDEETGRPAWARLERRLMGEMFTGDPDAAKEGLLAFYEKHIAPSLMQQQKAAVEGEVDMLEELGPRFMEAQRAADPGTEKLRLGLQRRAQRMVDAGQGMTREELAGISEGVRSAQSARGEAYQRSQPAMIQETMARLGMGRQAEAQRMATASNVLAQTGQQDAMAAVLGRSARMPGQVAGQFGTGAFGLQAAPQLYNPESQYGAALAGMNQTNIMNARMASAANKAAILGATVKAAGDFAGAKWGNPG